MSRNRMIKSEFWKDPKVGKMSAIARLLFIGMWNFADDSGIVRGDPIYLRSEIFTYDDITKKEINNYTNELIELEVITTVKNNGETYFLIKNFLEHQVINRPSNFRYIKCENDDYDLLINDSLNNHGVITERSLPKEKVKVKDNVKDKGKGISKIVIDYLNEKTNKNFQQVESNHKELLARIKEGYTEDQFKFIIDNKLKDPYFQDNPKYYNPDTLFRKSNIEKYLNEKFKQTIDNKFVGSADSFAAPKRGV